MLRNQTAYADDGRSPPADAGRRSKPGRTISAPRSLSRGRGVNTRRLQAMLRTTSDTSETLIGPPLIQTVTVTGPFNPTGPGDTPSRRADLQRAPASAAKEEGCARTILDRAGPARLSRHADAALTSTNCWHSSGRAARRQLRLGASGSRCSACSPGPSSWCGSSACRRRGRARSTASRDAELASRLSFFLWSSIPDDELLELAARAG